MSIILNKISKSFDGKRVLDHFDLVLEPGHIYGLMGPSGSGKTTLLRILAGLEKPDSGSVSGLSGLRIGMLFQENRLLEFAGPVTNVLFGAPRGMGKADARSHLLEVLPDEDPAQCVSAYSGGMKRRVALVRAVLPPSGLLLLDEPFTGLDEAARDMAIHYILRRQDDRTILFSTHDPTDLPKMGAEAIWVQGGGP